MCPSLENVRWTGTVLPSGSFGTPGQNFISYHWASQANLYSGVIFIGNPGSITVTRPPLSRCKVIDFMITTYVSFWNKFELHIFKCKGMTTVDVWWTGPSNRVLSVSLTRGCPRVRGVGRAVLVPQMQGSHCLVCILQERSHSFLLSISYWRCSFKSIR